MIIFIKLLEILRIINRININKNILKLNNIKNNKITIKKSENI